MDEEKFCTCDEFCQQQDDWPYRVFCDTLHTIGQFLQDLQEDGKFRDFNYMIKLVESDQQKAINIITRYYYCTWQNLQIRKKRKH